jgi:hypothetical protein
MGDINKVTHQGCPVAPADASLRTCQTPSARELTIVAGSVKDTVPAIAGTVRVVVLVCRRCTHRLLPQVRQGYLRASSHRWRKAHDHPT